MEVPTRIYNNVIIGSNYGIYLANAIAPDVKNNVVVDNVLHLYSPKSPAGYQEEHQLFFPDGEKFKVGGYLLNFADYSA